MPLLPPFLHPLSSAASGHYIEAQFIHQHWGPSHALWWPCLDNAGILQQPEILLVFIPGNPGIVDFYTHFLTTIFNQVSGNLSILAHAHVDHVPKLQQDSMLKMPSRQNLHVQIQSLAEFMDAVMDYYPKTTKIVLAGHSVGSWLTLQMLKDYGERIYAAFLLYPTISYIGDTPNGKRLKPIFLRASISILSNLSPITTYLPRGLFQWLFPSWPLQQLEILRRFLSSSTAVRASLNMASEEMEIITDLDYPLLKKYQDCLYFIYAKHDDWVGKERDRVLKVLGERSLHIVHGPRDVPHAFCIDPDHSASVAACCINWLSLLFLNEVER